MTITVTPTLTVADVAVAQSTAGAPPLVAVDELRLTWGRASVLEAPQAATAGLTVLDRTAGATFARRTDLIGQIVALGWSGSDGSSGITFRGRVTDGGATPLPGAVAGGGFRTAFAASSIEVDLANYTLPEGTVWPAESFAARAARIRAAIPAGLITGGLNLPGRFDLNLQYALPPDTDLDTLTAAGADVSGRDVLALIRELYASMSPLPAVYDPTADRFTFASRHVFVWSPIGWTASAQAVAAPERAGRYVPASLAGVRMDGHLTEYAGSLTQQIDSRITRVEVSYFDTAAADTRTVAAATVNTGSESSIGRRVLAVSSIHSTAVNAQQLANLYADVASLEARTPRLGSLGYSSDREPLRSGVHAATLLAGAETSGTVFIGRSWLPQLGQRPLVGILGGTVTYRAGSWTADLTPGPTRIDPSPFAWAPITPAACAPTVRARDIDPSLTFGDVAYLDVGIGYSTSTGSPYRGNPNP